MRPVHRTLAILLASSFGLSCLAASPDQVLASPAFERFARTTDRVCPSRHLRATTPGDLDWLQEGFEATLSPTDRQRLVDAGQHGQRACARRDGLSCPTAATLHAMARLKMLHAFALYACSHDVPR